MLKERFYTVLFILLVMACVVPVSKALACRCISDDVHALFEASDIVVLATPVEKFSDDLQQVSVQRLIKGEVPTSGFFISQQEGACKKGQLPMSHEQEHLLFVSKSGHEYKLNTSCSINTEKNGSFNLRMGEIYADVHRSMVAPFLKAKGEVPKLRLFTSQSTHETGYKSWLSISNLGDKDVEIFHPSNRQAFTFFVLDSYGNPVSPQGYAKVDSMGGALTLPAGGTYNHKIEPASNLQYPYLSGTAMFGYSLEENKAYQMHLVYRPYGGTYGAVVSEEKRIP